jgi:hypothetical protein
LLDAGGIEIVKERYEHGGKEYTVLGLQLKDREKALEAIKELCVEVQRIKSTSDTQSCKKLFEQFGNYVRDLEHLKTLHENQKAVIGDLKVSAQIFPKFEPVYKDDKIVDVSGSWPNDIVDQFSYYKELMMSTK